MDLSMNMAILSKLIGSNGAEAANAAGVTAGDKGSNRQATSFRSLLSQLMNSDTTENKTLSQLKSLLNASSDDGTNVADLILKNDVMGTQYSLLSEKLVPGSMMMDAMYSDDESGSGNTNDWMSQLSMFGAYGNLSMLQMLTAGQQETTSQTDLLSALFGNSKNNSANQMLEALSGLQSSNGMTDTSALMEALTKQSLENQLQEISDAVMAQANEGYDVSGMLAALENLTANDDPTGILTELKSQLEALQSSKASQTANISQDAESAKTAMSENYQPVVGIVENRLKKSETNANADMESEQSVNDLRAGSREISQKDNTQSGLENNAERHETRGKEISGADMMPGTTFSETIQAQTAAASAEPVNAVSNTAEVTTQQPAAEAQPVYTQLGDEILKHIDQKGPMQFKMQLEPENLGQIDVELKMMDGQLIIDIISQSSQTHSLLVSQVDKLIMNLGLQNVQVESVQVNSEQSVHAIEDQLSSMNTDGFEKQRQQQQYENQNKQNHIASMIDGNDDLSEMAEILSIMRDGSRRMDYMI